MVSLPVGWCPGRDAVVKDGRKGPPQNALTSFVDPAEVQPKYFDRPYYLEAVPKLCQGKTPRGSTDHD